MDANLVKTVNHKHEKPTRSQTQLWPRATLSPVSRSVIGPTYGLETRAPAPPGEDEPAVVFIVRAADVHPTRGDQERGAQEKEEQRGK